MENYIMINKIYYLKSDLENYSFLFKIILMEKKV